MIPNAGRRSKVVTSMASSNQKRAAVAVTPDAQGQFDLDRRFQLECVNAIRDDWVYVKVCVYQTGCVTRRACGLLVFLARPDVVAVHSAKSIWLACIRELLVGSSMELLYCG
jgi:hypothetical protein